MFAWNDSMATGIYKIDAQHKEIFKKFNEFADVFATAKFNAKKMEEAENILDFLQFYADWHFSKEEEYFEQYHCPAAEVNKKAHMQFRRMFGQFYEQWQHQGMNMELAEKTFNELVDWFINHILKVDVQLHAYVKAESDNQAKSPVI